MLRNSIQATATLEESLPRLKAFNPDHERVRIWLKRLKYRRHSLRHAIANMVFCPFDRKLPDMKHVKTAEDRVKQDEARLRGCVACIERVERPKRQLYTWMASRAAIVVATSEHMSLNAPKRIPTHRVVLRNGLLTYVYPGRRVRVGVSGKLVKGTFSVGIRNMGNEDLTVEWMEVAGCELCRVMIKLPASGMIKRLMGCAAGIEVKGRSSGGAWALFGIC